LQLREKQRVKRIYGVLERQFRTYFEKAAQMKGIVGENLLALLERRLDNVLFRAGLGTSRAQARQVVRHGHVQVNGRKTDVPSYLVKPGDVVEIREGSRKHAGILASVEATAHSLSPSWIEVDREKLAARITGIPRRDELVQIPINEQLIVELYSR
jgi:small subunit ribosomal protein S4